MNIFNIVKLSEYFYRAANQPFKSYYDIEDETVEDVLNNWRFENKQLYDTSDYHKIYKVEDIYKYREYTWTKYNGRNSEEEWDKLYKSMDENGWDVNNPAIIQVGKNGKAKVAEGNHRLAIAKQLNIPVPVRFIFYSNVELNS